MELYEAQSKTQGLGLTLLMCPASDTVEERPLNLEEKAALVTKPKRGSRNKWHEHGRVNTCRKRTFIYECWTRQRS